MRLPKFKLPASFPANSLNADRLALVAARHGKIAEFTHAVYRLEFVEGRDIATRDVLAEALKSAGLDAASCGDEADSEEIKAQLRKNTEDAQARGTFGAPTFFVDGKLFFGNDRLAFVEKALSSRA